MPTHMVIFESASGFSVIVAYAEIQNVQSPGLRLRGRNDELLKEI